MFHHEADQGELDVLRVGHGDFLAAVFGLQEDGVVVED